MPAWHFTAKRALTIQEGRDHREPLPTACPVAAAAALPGLGPGEGQKAAEEPKARGSAAALPPSHRDAKLTPHS